MPRSSWEVVQYLVSNIFGWRGTGWNWGDTSSALPAPSFWKILRLVVTHAVMSDMATTLRHSLKDHPWIYPPLDCIIITSLFTCSLGIIQALHYLAPPIFSYSPEMYPPVMGTKWWVNTRIRSFWGRGWHQLFRRVFWTMGYIPGSKIAGTLGGVTGAYLCSGLFHDLGVRYVTGSSDWQMIGFFAVQVVGCVLERGIFALPSIKSADIRSNGWLGVAWLWVWLWISARYGISQSLSDMKVWDEPLFFSRGISGLIFGATSKLM